MQRKSFAALSMSHSSNDAGQGVDGAGGGADWSEHICDSTKPHKHAVPI